MTKLPLALALLLPVAAVFVGRAAEVARRPTEIQADNMTMRTVGTETRAVFTGTVTLTGTNLRIVADRIEVVAQSADEKGAAAPKIEAFRHLLATGHVRIVQGTREATAGRAEVFPAEEKVVLTESPIVIDHMSDPPHVTAGESITWRRGESGLDIVKPRYTGPDLRDLGFDAKKAGSPPAAPKAGESK